MTAADVELCPGCGLKLDIMTGPAAVHAYLGASASCWSLFGGLLAREFNDQSYFAVHQLTVDAYAVQHPGVPGRRSTQSVGLHLMTLCQVFERDLDIVNAPAMRRRMLDRPQFTWLKPPAPIGMTTIRNVLEATSAEAHAKLVWAWAENVWDAWSPHHDTIRRWLDESPLTDEGDS